MFVVIFPAQSAHQLPVLLLQNSPLRCLLWERYAAALCALPVTHKKTEALPCSVEFCGGCAACPIRRLCMAGLQIVSYGPCQAAGICMLLQQLRVYSQHLYPSTHLLALLLSSLLGLLGLALLPGTLHSQGSMLLFLQQGSGCLCGCCLSCLRCCFCGLM